MSDSSFANKGNWNYKQIKVIIRLIYVYLKLGVTELLKKLLNY